MNRPRPSIHPALLVLFCVLMCGVWLLPVILAGGFPYEAPTLLLARNYAVTGLFSQSDALGRLLSPTLLPSIGLPSTLDGRFSAMLFAFLGHSIEWWDFFNWTVVSSVLMALALIPWWLTVRKVFDVSVAWVSTVLLAFMPLYWREAVNLTNYPLSFLFLFCSFAAFVWMQERRPLLALAVSGLLFGLSVSAKDAFLVFVPWLIIGYLWTYRRVWKKAVLGVFIFGVCSGAMYLLPYVGDLGLYGYPVNQNLARIWPVGGETTKNMEDATYLHLYPDPYTYFQDKERFDRDYLASLPGRTMLERWQGEKLLINFGVGQISVVAFVLSGLWILLNSIPAWFQQGLIGGFALWLFLLPGGAQVWKKKRTLAQLLLGFVAVSYVVINIVLHYEREHLMDFMWIIALLAGVGVINVSELLAAKWKRKVMPIAAAITVILAGQMIQTNRIEFARLYAKSNVPWIQATAASLTVPATAVVALPYHPGVMEAVSLLSGKTVVLFQPETIERLLAEKKLPAVFAQYQVTHISGYNPELTQAMQKSVRSLAVIQEVDPARVKPLVSPLTQYLLHIIR